MTARGTDNAPKHGTRALIEVLLLGPPPGPRARGRRSLGTEAAMKGYRVPHTVATRLVNELVEAADEKQLNKTFTDPRLCAAIVDRLTSNDTIMETGTDSYRLASTPSRVGAEAS